MQSASRVVSSNGKAHHPSPSVGFEPRPSRREQLANGDMREMLFWCNSKINQCKWISTT